MNENQRKVRLRRIEKLGDTLAGGFAASAISVLGVPGSVLFAHNLTLAVVLMFAAGVTYGVFSWVLHELSASMVDPSGGAQPEDDA